MSINEDDAKLAMLTPEERAALTEPDDEDTTATQGELEDQAKAAAGTTTTEGSDDEDNGNDDAGAAGADGAAAPVGDAKPAAGGADEQGEPAGKSAQQAPILVAQAPEDAEAKLADIASKKADLRKQYDEGDITHDEYESQKEALDEQRLEIKLAVKEAETAAKMETQRLQNQWNADCESFLGKHSAIYGGDANKEVFAHLNETIIAYAKMPRNAGLTGPELLEKAHKAVMLERGTPVAEPKADPKPGKAAAPKPNLPPDMSRLPAATANDPGEGRWASLDKLADTNPAAYEAALAKMSEAERDEYLKV